MKETLYRIFFVAACFVGLAHGQTVTFTTSGGGAFPLHFNVVSEMYQGNQVGNSGSFEVAQDYGYPQSAIILPYNPVAPGEYLNPVITITATTTTYNAQVSRTTTYTFNSNADPQYGYVWAGTFTGTELCTAHRFGKCTNYGQVTDGSGTMTATAQ